MKIAIGAMVFFLVGCGTGTGNPEVRHSQPSNGALAAVLLQPLCSKISECHPEATAVCENSVGLQSNFGSRLGLGPTNSETLNSIFDKVATGTYKLDQQAYQNCKTDLGALTCDSSAVQNAYVAGDSEPFRRSAELLGSSCASVLTP